VLTAVAPDDEPGDIGRRVWRSLPILLALGMIVSAALVALTPPGGPPAFAWGILALIYGWLLWRQYQQLRFVRALAVLKAYRRDCGGWNNMSAQQRADWLAALRHALERSGVG
jgi:hypothetical protein